MKQKYNQLIRKVVSCMTAGVVRTSKRNGYCNGEKPHHQRNCYSDHDNNFSTGGHTFESMIKSIPQADGGKIKAIELVSKLSKVSKKSTELF